MQTNIVFCSVVNKSQLTRSLIMEQARRKFLATSIAGGAALAAWGVLRPVGAYAAQFNASVTKANSLAEAYRGLGAEQMAESRDILIKAPNIAENGSVVPVEVVSKIAGTSAIAILIERNNNPFAANFNIPAGTEGYAATRVKMAETSPLHAVVKVGDKHFHAVKDVKITIGGCGGAPDTGKKS